MLEAVKEVQNGGGDVVVTVDYKYPLRSIQRTPHQAKRIRYISRHQGLMRHNVSNKRKGTIIKILIKKKIF
jgi:hypothetical protein